MTTVITAEPSKLRSKSRRRLRRAGSRASVTLFAAALCFIFILPLIYMFITAFNTSSTIITPGAPLYPAVGKVYRCSDKAVCTYQDGYVDVAAITSATAPKLGSTAATVASVDANAYSSADVTTTVTKRAPVSLAVTNPSTTTPVIFASKESANKPQLVITTCAPAKDTTPPSAPAGLTATAKSGTEIDLSWTASTDDVAVAGYLVYRDGAAIDSVPYGSTTWFDTGVGSGEHIYAVSAVDASANESPKSAEVKASVHKDVTKPSRPTDVTVTSSSAASVAVTWTASTDDTGVVSYTISRNGTKLSQVSGSTASFVDVAVQPGTTYTYTVAANDAAGNASDASAAGSVTTPSGSAPAADTTAPSAPAGLIAKAKSGTEIDLSWTASTDNVAVAGYKVYRDGAVVATVGSTSWFDTGLAAGGEYSYEVSAVDAAGNESAKTSPVKQTTAKDSTAPSAPANLSATATAWNEVTLTWAASTDDVGVASYNIKRGGETIARVSGPTLTFVDHTTTIQTEYKYTVTATDAANNSSAPSNEVAVTTPVWKSCVTTTTPVDPVADSYVNQASPATNYGTETKLVALGTSETVYLKFDLTNLPAGQITGATLRLYSTTASSSGYTVASVEDTSWGEVHWVPTTIQDRTGTDLDLYEVPLEGKGITQLALLQDSEPTTGQPCIFIDPVTNTQVKIFVNSVELSRVWQFHINMDNFATAAGWADSITTGAVTNDSLGGMLIGNGFLRFFFNTVIIAVLGTIGATLSAIIVAYGFARFRIPGRDALFLVLIGTILLPFQVTLIPQFIIFHAIGWAGTWYPLIVPHYFSNAYNVFLLRQYFLTLPRELDEAAMMDGASPFRVLISIIIPQSWPAIAAVMLFHFFFAWNDFLGPLIYLTGKPDLYPIAIGLNYFNTTFRVNNAPPAIQAGALLSLILPVVIFFFAQRVFMRGVVISGVEK